MLVQLNNQRLNEITAGVLSFVDHPATEKDILELLEARQILEDAYKALTNALKKDMTDKGLNSVEGDVARISISSSGAKYKAKDIKEVPAQFLEIKLNSEAVAAYEKDFKKLPDNVTYADRSTACRITLKKGAND